MEGGFRFLLGGIVLMALAFSLVSVWPALTETKPNHAATQVNNQKQSIAPAIPTPPSVNTPHQGSPNTQSGNVVRPSSQVLQPTANPMGIVANAPPVNVELTRPHDWVYTTRLVKLLKEPDGDAHRALSINNSELEILSGTRLIRVRTEDGWVLVQSPSDLYGWLRETDVSVKAPPATDPEWSLHPSS